MSQPPGRALLAARVFDGRALRPEPDLAVWVEGETIREVAPRAALPPNLPTVELGDRTLMPGLIDCHAHPLIRGDDFQGRHLRRSSAWKALRGLEACQGLLRAGWTGLRVAGDADVHFAHLELRRAFDEGLFRGPRLCGAGHYLSITGGVGDLNFLAPEQVVAADGVVVDGVDAVRRAVRHEVKHGSDWIKLLASGGLDPRGPAPTEVHFSPEELRAAVDEATRLGVPVMAHAHSAAAIHQALRAGVRSIEHGSFVDAEAIELFLEHDAWLVPTLFVLDYLEGVGGAGAARGCCAASSGAGPLREQVHQNIAGALAAGVKVACGTDFLGWEPGLGVRELELLVACGMTPSGALAAATDQAAELLGWQGRSGRVAAGRIADLVAVPGDPTADITRMRGLDFVMLGGEVVRGLPSSG